MTMRIPVLLLVGCLCSVEWVQAQEKKSSKDLPPIPEIKLDRKEPVVYQKDIEPIFAEKCMYCHSGNVIEGKYDMSTYAGVMKGGKRGAVIIAGKSSESILYHFSSRQKKPIMPPKSEDPLTPEELALLKLWIDQGAKPPTGVREKAKIVLNFPPALVKPVRAVAVSPDKSIVATGRGNQIHLFDAKTGNFLKSLVDPNLKHPDGKPAAAAHMSLVESLEYAPDGKTLISGSFQEAILWDPATGAIRKRIDGFADRVVAIAFSDDSQRFVTGGGAPTEDGEIKIFKIDGTPEFEVKSGHSDTVFGVRFSPDGKMLATCGADKFVKVWSVPDAKLIKSFEGHTHHVMDVGWKADGKFLASAGADNAIKVWDFEKGEQARTINGHSKQVTRLMFVGKTPMFITASGDQQLKMWNVDNGGNVRNFGGSKDYLYAVSVSTDGSLVVSGGEEGITRLYNGTSGAIIKEMVPPADGKPEVKPDAKPEAKPMPKK
ncbi:WD40 domain-containing protein [Tuwongella immobilis]|uniref:Cytochrome C Planctomycete-type domain-containing protein n=1 Tax=Tuwongella immobilis TaxID=692036 RepID=A0A6C2YSM0_9BACT|nr:c-type cytochrome domain-containing protein [Tuwongella immobilis]VIP04708.1 wd40 repeat-containing protein : NB-ARC domain protein OS=uncultured planctomycete GN=HGMM_F07G10C27 PE=4 SV=1: PSCyt1: WD40: WD40: WD40: WD40 [Tuwongella immobilis]VTS06775.1 wd40 repeat-containing protein : NB-ARC domain protein OS=uncultured planctomycete GN=HGMM_F07G10C27 PE=4 SV=1: PSCyt1: WD40: WD40: WD40: WD40 [Tuwongella immobilis]